MIFKPEGVRVLPIRIPGRAAFLSVYLGDNAPTGGGVIAANGIEEG